MKEDSRDTAVDVEHFVSYSHDFVINLQLPADSPSLRH